MAGPRVLSPPLSPTANTHTLRQAAGAAAYLAIRDKVAVQDVSIPDLQALQRANGVEPHYPAGRCP